MRSFLIRTTLASCVLTMLTGHSVATEPTRPNILLILTDDHGRFAARGMGLGGSTILKRTLVNNTIPALSIPNFSGPWCPKWNNGAKVTHSLDGFTS